MWAGPELRDPAEFMPKWPSLRTAYWLLEELNTAVLPLPVKRCQRAEGRAMSS
jgi:hypothetical protein